MYWALPGPAKKAAARAASASCTAVVGMDGTAAGAAAVAVGVVVATPERAGAGAPSVAVAALPPRPLPTRALGLLDLVDARDWLRWARWASRWASRISMGQFAYQWSAGSPNPWQVLHGEGGGPLRFGGAARTPREEEEDDEVARVLLGSRMALDVAVGCAVVASESPSRAARKPSAESRL